MHCDSFRDGVTITRSQPALLRALGSDTHFVPASVMVERRP
ncbi:hypothetical protein SBBP1_890013 [Burkholderiales bacterium]|nr:hypothetical protein SBBP1_890013 [Burkholderiales bacterium]